MKLAIILVYTILSFIMIYRKEKKEQRKWKKEDQTLKK